MSLSQSGARSQPDLVESQETHVKRVMGGFQTNVRDNTAMSNSIFFAGPVADEVITNYAVKYVGPHLSKSLAKRRKYLTRQSATSSIFSLVIIGAA
jgi:hypothetical protein